MNGRQQISGGDAGEDRLGELGPHPVRAQEQIEGGAFAAGGETKELECAFGGVGVDVECDGLPEIGKLSERGQGDVDLVADPPHVDHDARGR